MKLQNRTPSLRDDAQAVVDSCGSHLVRIAARQITRYVDQKMRTTDLAIEQFTLLAVIAAAKDDSLSAISEAACLDKSTLSRNLRGLEHKGLVEIAANVRGSRRRHVWLTEAGARKLEEAMPVWRAANAALNRYVDVTVTKKIASEARRLNRKRS